MADDGLGLDMVRHLSPDGGTRFVAQGASRGHKPGVKEPRPWVVSSGRTPSRRGARFQRVKDTESRKKERKVPVGGRERRAVLDRQRREMRVHHERPLRLSGDEQIAQNWPVTLAGGKDHNGRLLQPLRDDRGPLLR